MTRRRPSPATNALAAFGATVVLAILAAVSAVTPDIAVKSVDAMAEVPLDIDLWLPVQPAQ